MAEREEGARAAEPRRSSKRTRKGLRLVKGTTDGREKRRVEQLDGGARVESGQDCMRY